MHQTVQPCPSLFILRNAFKCNPLYVLNAIFFMYITDSNLGNIFKAKQWLPTKLILTLLFIIKIILSNTFYKHTCHSIRCNSIWIIFHKLYTGSLISINYWYWYICSTSVVLTNPFIYNQTCHRVKLDIVNESYFFNDTFS